MKTERMPENVLDLFRGASPDDQRELVGMVRRVCRRVGNHVPKHEWEDYCADVTTDVCERLSNTADSADDKTLYRVIWDSARNVNFRRISASRFRIKAGILEWGADCPEGLYSESEVDSLLRLIAILPESLRDTAEKLAVYHLPSVKDGGGRGNGFSQDIGEITGKASGTIRSHVSKMRKILPDRGAGNGHFARAVREAYDNLLSDEWAPYTTAPAPEQRQGAVQVEFLIGNPAEQHGWNDTENEIRGGRHFDDMVADVKTDPESGRLVCDGGRYPNPQDLIDAIQEGIAIAEGYIQRDRQEAPEWELFRAVDRQPDQWCRQPSRAGLGPRATLYGTERTARQRFICR